MEWICGFTIITGIGILLLNLIVFALNLKLYTEIFKAWDVRKRKE